MADNSPDTLFAKLMIGADRALSLLEDGLMGFAALALSATGIVLVVDVGLRYLANAPMQWTYDFVANYLMAAAFFFAVSQTLRKRQHISIDLFPRMGPQRLVHATHALGMVLALALFAAMAYQGLLSTHKSFVDQEHIIGGISWPVWISKIFWPVGLSVLCLRIGLNILLHSAHACGVRVPDIGSASLAPHKTDNEL
ncbi:MAG: TRAP transporter small permease [Neoaquamicrobium sediminum]|uniref:TRAP transporter small permease n=1 Tax=Neoaquamicrobium sediminum TaxID=1849104 RepID=UPI0040372025